MDDYAQALVDAADQVVVQWVQRCFARVAAQQGLPADQWASEARATGEEVREWVMPQLRSLLSLDPDHQDTTPLAVMRDGVPIINAKLNELGALPVERDEFEKRSFPGDDFRVTPANWSDIDESLVDPGIAWGAARAMAHKERHGPGQAG